ncbi:MAG TPA: hypothetical protein VJP40_10035 [bacterium]|nr:hypothetical protein [bacterium]
MKSLHQTWAILEARESDLPAEIQKKIAAAAEVLPLSRVLLLVSEPALAFLEEECAVLPPENVWVQPADWGNAPALAWCFRQLEKIEPKAKVLFIPSRGDFPSAGELESLMDRIETGHPSTQVLFLNLAGNHIPDSALLGSVSTLLLLLMMCCPQLVRPWMQGALPDEFVPRDLERDLYRDVLLGNPLFLEEWNMLPENDAALGILSFQSPRAETPVPLFTMGSVN